MELKEGMYLRTKDGVIGKLQNKIYVGYGDFIIDTLYYNFDEIINRWTCNIKKYDVKKASYNIIDLIEDKDILKYIYDGEEYISEVILCGDNKMIKVTSNLQVSIGLVDIKSIVTKEQFESMEYKVE